MVNEISGWCCGTWMDDFSIQLGMENDPNWRTPSFFRGVGWNHQPDWVYQINWGFIVQTCPNLHCFYFLSGISITIYQKVRPWALVFVGWYIHLGKFHHDRSLFSRSLESWFILGKSSPFMAQLFRLVNYNLPRPMNTCSLHSPWIPNCCPCGDAMAWPMVYWGFIAQHVMNYLRLSGYLSSCLQPYNGIWWDSSFYVDDNCISNKCDVFVNRYDFRSFTSKQMTLSMATIDGQMIETLNAHLTRNDGL